MGEPFLSLRQSCYKENTSWTKVGNDKPDAGISFFWSHMVNSLADQPWSLYFRGAMALKSGFQCWLNTRSTWEALWSSNVQGTYPEIVSVALGRHQVRFSTSPVTRACSQDQGLLVFLVVGQKTCGFLMPTCGKVPRAKYSSHGWRSLSFKTFLASWIFY